MSPEEKQEEEYEVGPAVRGTQIGFYFNSNGEIAEPHSPGSKMFKLPERKRRSARKRFLAMDEDQQRAILRGDQFSSAEIAIMMDTKDFSPKIGASPSRQVEEDIDGNLAICDDRGDRGQTISRTANLKGPRKRLAVLGESAINTGTIG